MTRPGGRRCIGAVTCATWTDRDGAGRLDARLTPEGLARFQACLRPFQTERFDAARRAGGREKPECYAADALLALAAHATTHHHHQHPHGRYPAAGTGDRDGRRAGVQGGRRRDGTVGTARPAGAARRVGPPATVVALVDHAALVRGHVQDQECCVIQGIGPVPVATVRALLDDAFLAAVVTDGIDIRSVVHIGRRPTAAQWTALWVRDRACVVPGCGIAVGLEAHHLTGWSTTKTTRLDDLALLCSHHHDLASYHGWTLTGPPGQRAWHPPPNPTPPGPFDDDGLHLPYPTTTHPHPAPHQPPPARATQPGTPPPRTARPLTPHPGPARPDPDRTEGTHPADRGQTGPDRGDSPRRSRPDRTGADSPRNSWPEPDRCRLTPQVVARPDRGGTHPAGRGRRDLGTGPMTRRPSSAATGPATCARFWPVPRVHLRGPRVIRARGPLPTRTVEPTVDHWRLVHAAM